MQRREEGERKVVRARDGKTEMDKGKDARERRDEERISQNLKEYGSNECVAFRSPSPRRLSVVKMKS